VTEIHDISAFSTRAAAAALPGLRQPIERQTIDRWSTRARLPEGAKAQIIAPCVRGRKGEHQKRSPSSRGKGMCACA
jgi:excinuclease UvrABC ATPase subunit